MGSGYSAAAGAALCRRAAAWYMLPVVTVETPNDDLLTLSDRELAERICRQLDHLDAMLHEVTQFLDEHKPALNRALGFLDAGRSMRGYLAGRPRAGGPK